MKRERPAEREIAGSIAPAFDRLPEPDAQRLAAIGRRLLAQARPRRRIRIAWWWLLGALLAGAASALWWTVNYDSTKGPVAPIESRSMPSPAADETNRPGAAENTNSTPAGETAQKSGPSIFKRER